MICSPAICLNPQPTQFFYTQNVTVTDPNAAGTQITVSSPNFLLHSYADVSGTDTVASTF